MLNQNQIQKVKDSYSRGDACVFQIGYKVYVADRVLKHKKEATIEFVECYEIDESCFESDGEYYGDITGEEKTIILSDPFADYEYAVGTFYYPDELVEII